MVAMLEPKISSEANKDGERLAGRRERQRLSTRERLLSAALELFASQGFAETTIDQIGDQPMWRARRFSTTFGSRRISPERGPGTSRSSRGDRSGRG